MKLEELAGEHLDGRYALESVIGTGGYGAVFEAMQLSVQRPCAVKVLSPSLCDDETSLERFENEARMTARLKHPHTVRIFDYGRDEDLGVVFLVMELLEGFSLKHRVQTRGPLSLADTLDVVDAVAESLDEAHEMGMVHRDVKPHNIMLTQRRGRSDFVKVIDFGIAKALGPTAEDRELTATGMMIGTPTFMAPEQIRSADIDGRTDQYALAVTVYYMLTGETPFRGASTLEAASRHLTESAPALSAFKPQLDLPRLFDAVLLKALAKAPEARFESMHAFAEALRGAFDGEIPKGPTGLVPASKTPEQATDEAPSGSLQATRMTTPAVQPDEGATLATVALDAAADGPGDGPPPPPRPYSIRPLVIFAVLGVSLGLVGLGSTAMSWAPSESEPSEFGVAQDRETRPPAETVPEPSEPFALTATPESTLDDTPAPDPAEPEPSPGFAEAVQAALAARNVAATKAETSAEDAAATAAKAKAAKNRKPNPPVLPDMGVVQATLIPWGDLFADGKRLGRGSRIRAELPAGRHTLEMRQGERLVGEKVVRILGGKTTAVEMVAQ